MSRHTFETDNFRCKLHCDQCTHIKDDGTRCRNRVCIGTPTCWIHNKKKYDVRVRDSTIGNFKGLFAERDFLEGEWICPYIGERITRNCLDQRYPGDITAPYAVKEGGRWVNDSACRRGIGAMANAKFRADGSCRARSQHNAFIDPRPNRGQWLRADVDISEGEEIFVWYGLDYRLDMDHKTYRTTRPETRPC